MVQSDNKETTSNSERETLWRHFVSLVANDLIGTYEQAERQAAAAERMPMAHARHVHRATAAHELRRLLYQWGATQSERKLVQTATGEWKPARMEITFAVAADGTVNTFRQCSGTWDETLHDMGKVIVSLGEEIASGGKCPMARTAYYGQEHKCPFICGHRVLNQL